MCSATFTINNSFDYFFTKLPLKCDENIDINTNIYKSPFFMMNKQSIIFLISLLILTQVNI